MGAYLDDKNVNVKTFVLILADLRAITLLSFM